MPVLNDASHVRAAVESILAQDYHGPVEVLIALGPSIDGTAELVADLATRDARVRVLENEVGSTPAGLNIGIRAARYPVVVRVDSHSMLPSDYARVAVETLVRTGADNVGGIMDARGETPFERAVALAYTTQVGLGGSAFHVGGEEGPGRDRLPRRLPPGRARTRRALRRDHQARPGLGAEPSPSRDRRHRLVHARAWRSPTVRGRRRAARTADVLDRAVARRARAPVPGRQRHPVLHSAGHGPRGRARACSASAAIVQVALGAAPWLLVGSSCRRSTWSSSSSRRSATRGPRAPARLVVSRSVAVHPRLVGSRVRARLPLADEQHREHTGR